LTSTPPTAPNHRIAIAVVTRQHVNTGRIFVRNYTPAYRLADLSNVASTAPTSGQALSWDGTKWAPANVGYTPGTPPPGGFLGNVFYQDNAGNFTFEDEFRYTASTNTLAVENITGTTVTGSGVVKGSNTFGQRYATQAATNRAAADTASLTVERYFTVTAEGNGESFNIQSDTPSAGNKIVRKIWYKDEAFEDTDVDTWTLLHTFADDATYASTATKWQEYLDGQANGTPPFTLTISWEDIPAFTGLLDTYSGAAAAYSLRLLDSTYTGDAIRVRRASDNAEQDISFDGNGDLDTSALTTFCTGTDGFVKTWYDQSGNANDATQTTTAEQPKIYDSSTGVELENGVAGLNASGIKYLPFSVSLSGNTFVTGVGSITGASERGLIRDATDQLYIGWNALKYRVELNNARTESALLASAPGQILVSANVLTTGGGFYVNGSLSFSLPYTAFSTNASNVGSDRDGSFDVIQEVIIYPSDQSANRAGIESNINDYYNVY
jgi:hypothetical protein